MFPAQVRRRGAILTLALALGLLSACGNSDANSSSSAGTTSAGSTSSSAADTSASSSDSGAATSASSSASSAPASSEVTATEADFSITLDSPDLTAGDYTINITNTGRATHDLVVEKGGADVAKSATIAPGQSATLKVTLDPGSYVFYCSIGNHRAMGMETNVTVS
jgi:plastocyanin